MVATLASPAHARTWLAEMSAGNRRAVAVSGLLLVLDALPAIGFAGGLAMGVATLSQGPSTFAPWLLLAVVSAAARGALAKVSIGIGAKAAMDVKGLVRHRVVRRALAQSPGGPTTSGEVMAAAIEGVEALDGYFVRFAPARLAASLAPLLILAAIALASPVCAVILALALIPFVLGMALCGLASAAESQRHFEALERLSGLFLDKVRALPLVLAFEAEHGQTESLARAADELQYRTTRILRRAFLSSAVMEFFAALSVALTAVYCGFNLLGVLPFPAPERLELGAAFFVLALAPEVYTPMRRLAAVYHDRQAAETAAPRLSPAAPPEPALISSPDLPPAITFAGVRVRYPGGDQAAVENFDLRLSPGSVTALLGPSGSGKSTLLHLLLGLAPLTSGEVNVGDLRLSDTRGFARLIAWAGQAPFIAPGTLAENIGLAHRGSSRRDIEQAAARVGLFDAIAARPLGLESRIDERGSGLSGGERRRIALARALLKPAPILLLDEPTANLDAEAEQDILPVIREAARGRTVLIATHSEAVAALADQVVRL